MKIGDKVKSIRGEKVGIIEYMTFLNKSSETTNTARGLKTGKPKKYFNCKAEDGTEFSRFEDDLELIE